MGDKMKRTMALALSVFATFLVIAMQPANAQTEGGEYELAVKKALAELKKVPADMAVLETSNKNLSKSDLVQIETSKMLDKQARRIKDVDAPALIRRAAEFDRKNQQTLASGCSANATADAALARRCNAANDAARAEMAAIQAAQRSVEKQAKMISDTRAAVNKTALANADKRKKNNAAINDLEAKKLGLFSQVIARSMNVVKAKAAASNACRTLTNNEEATCCLSVVSDGKDPKQCNAPLLFKLFENAGVFSTSEIRPLVR
jgi:hypothetical protein